MAMAAQADIIMRGLAEVGIVALIDEATGFQRERAGDALIPSHNYSPLGSHTTPPWVPGFGSPDGTHQFSKVRVPTLVHSP